MKVDRNLTPKEYARLLRKNLTREEKMIWDLLRDRRLLGFKFLRQHPIRIWDTNGVDHFYFADFYCAEKKLVLEIDGPVHERQTDYDQGRELVMREQGFRTLRVTNQEVNETIEHVLTQIKQRLENG
jgi:very-short-patch-repair endonuclease